MKKRRISNKGITLIALVISIIIIIILAGITLGTLLGSNGLITRTKKAVEYYEKAQQDEVIEMDKLYTRLANIGESSGVTEAEMKKIITEIMYPVGSIYISTEISTKEDMNNRFGGEWESYAEGRTLIGVGTGNDENDDTSTFIINQEGGEYNHKLTIPEMPSHTHTGAAHMGGAIPSGGENNFCYKTENTGKTGGDQPHNNIQPYIAVYMWKRVG